MSHLRRWGAIPLGFDECAMTSRASKLRHVETGPIHIGLLAGEPVRDAGLRSIFDLPEQGDQEKLVPVVGSLPELLALDSIAYIVVDLHSSRGDLEALETVRRERPEIRSIVIGPEGDDELVLSSIVAGARAYLGHSAGPELVRKAIGVVTSGSIWAPRRLLCQMIDRLLKTPSVRQAIDNKLLTHREEQVLELILGAHSTREIATQLGIEQRTVKAYVGRLMRKTGADNRVKLSVSALNHSLLKPDNGGEGTHPGAGEDFKVAK
jgi:DNA-binding NarL/FixJ family response regulator